MAVDNCTMTHASVNGGTAVILQNSRIGFSFKKIQKALPITGKYDITEVEYGGIENPKIRITGSFDVEDISTNELTQELITEFLMIKSVTPISLSVPSGITGAPTYLKGRPTGGYETDGAMTLLNTINVSIDSFDLSFDGTSDQGRHWTYSLICTETI